MTESREVARRGRLLLAAVVSLALAPLPAAAFTSWEHCRLGNEGYRLALRYVEANPGRYDLSEEALKVLRDFKKRECEKYNREKPRARSYGEAVKVVDYVQRPHRLFANRSAGWITEPDPPPTAWEHLNPALPRKGGLESLRASAGNDHHFQGELFTEMRNGHRDAIEAARAGHLFYALVLNAISDHYLHDFFAPGHLATQRDNSHDAVALGLHDRINQNKKGKVRLKAERGWERLEPLLAFIEERCARENNPECPRWIEKKKLAKREKKLAEKPGKRKAVRNARRLDRWRPSPAESLSVIRSLPAAVCLQRAEDAPTAGPCGIPIRGDGQLAQVPEQQLFMLLVQMRSILDVADAFAGVEQDEPYNSFDSHRWTAFPDAETGAAKQTISEAAADACIVYACYRIEDQDRWWASDILMLGAGGQAPVSDSGSSRWEGAVELVPLSALVKFPRLRQRLVMRPDCGFKGLCNSTLVLGASYKGDDAFSALGPRVRVLKVLPKIDVQLSAQVEYLRYRPDQGVPSWEWTYGVRGDLGFSLMSLYVGVGSGFFAVDGVLERDLEVSFGLGIGLPIQRIKKFFRPLNSPWKGATGSS